MSAIDVRVAKLLSGEELIGRFVSETDTTLTLDRTLALLIQANERGEIGVVTAPFMVSAGDGAIKVNKAIVVGTPERVDSGLVDDYIRKTSPIALA